jgi:hypothetical protein
VVEEGPPCHKCGKEITGDRFQTHEGGHLLHPECFVCKFDGKPIGPEEEFAEYDG